MHKKSLEGVGMCLPNGRGHHKNHIQIPEEDKQIIKNHISMFPIQLSHYSRNQSNKHYFLNTDLTISDMYKLY